jgi:hypothetical protein
MIARSLAGIIAGGFPDAAIGGMVPLTTPEGDSEGK